jgi:ferredoxin
MGITTNMTSTRQAHSERAFLILSPKTMLYERSVEYKNPYEEVPKCHKAYNRWILSPVVKIPDPPVYKNVFQKMVELYSFPEKSSAVERFWVADLEENQYRRLEGPVNEIRTEFDSPEDAAEIIESFARSCGADLVGFTAISDDLVFTGADVKGRYAISIGFEMDFDDINTAPDPPAGVEALRAYWRLGWIVMKVSEFIRSLGYPAQGHQVRTFLNDPPTVLHTLTAVRAGLGEVGRSGLLITPELGPRLRVGTVTTDLELPETGEMTFGVEEFCSRCTTCADECRGGAIPYEMSMERGVLKYTIDYEKCLPEFARYDGCGICIRVCRFNRRRDEMRKFVAGVRTIGKE